MLKRAEPPICVGLYARWGSGKTFMISLLKKEFDEDVLQDPHTKKLLQFFEKGYEKLEPKQATPADEPETVLSLIFGLLLTIVSSFMPTVPSWVPYGVSTFTSIISDALDVRGALCAVWAWCSRLRRSCCKKGRTTDIRKDRLPWRQSLIAGLYEDYSWLPQEEEAKEEDVKRKDITKEFVFVDFNAWECAACAHLSSQALSTASIF